MTDSKENKQSNIESADDRFARYQRAVDRRREWESMLEQAYRYALPNKNTFWERRPGDERNLDIWDATAVDGLQTFASNMQALLIPPFRRWARLVAGRNIKEEDVESVNRQLQGIMEFFFTKLDSSNFALVANESFQEMGISLGTMLINEGNDQEPFEFVSVPITQIAAEAGKNGRLDNFWRTLEIPVEDIKKYWPHAVFLPETINLLKTAPSTPVKVIEGTIEYPFNPPGERIFYYVQMESNKYDIVKEFRKFNPWIGFRWSRSSGEVYGRGPILSALPFIREVNQLTEFKTVSAKFQAYPVYTAPSTGLINPYTLVIEPGSIIPIEPNFIDSPPIRPIPLAGNPEILDNDIVRLQAAISKILFSDPLGPVGGPNQTATEISIRQQNWVRKSGAAFGRLTVEFIKPIIEKGLSILWERGLISGLKTSDGEKPLLLDGNFIDIDYKSPLIDIQNADDLQSFQNWAAQLEGLFGKFGLVPMDGTKIPGWLAEKNNVDLELLRSAGEFVPEMEEFKQQIIQQIAPQQQAGQQPSAQPGQQQPGQQQPGQQPFQVAPIEPQQAPEQAGLIAQPPISPISG